MASIGRGWDGCKNKTKKRPFLLSLQKRSIVWSGKRNLGRWLWFPTRKNSPGIEQPQAHAHLSAAGHACLWLASLLHQPGSESTHAHLQTLLKRSRGSHVALGGLSITTEREAFSFSFRLWRQEVHLWLSSICYNDGGLAFLRVFM